MLFRSRDAGKFERDDPPCGRLLGPPDEREAARSDRIEEPIAAEHLSGGGRREGACVRRVPLARIDDAIGQRHAGGSMVVTSVRHGHLCNVHTTRFAGWWATLFNRRRRAWIAYRRDAADAFDVRRRLPRQAARARQEGQGRQEAQDRDGARRTSTIRRVKLDDVVAAAVAEGAGEAALTAFYDAASRDARKVRLLLRKKKKLVEALVLNADRHLALTARHPGAAVLVELLGPRVAEQVGGVKAQVRQIYEDEERRAMQPGRQEYPDQWFIDKHVDELVRSLAPAVRVAFRAAKPTSSA